MEPREIILQIMDVSDPPKLAVLKSKYNRYANRLNASRFGKLKGEHAFLMDELKLLKKEIDSYD